MCFNRYLSYERRPYADYSMAKPIISFPWKISFSLNLFSSHFYGQSFIKTAQGPLISAASTLLYTLLLVFSLTVKAATLIFISGRGSAISSAKQGLGKSGSIYNLVKN